MIEVTDHPFFSDQNHVWCFLKWKFSDLSPGDSDSGVLRWDWNPLIFPTSADRSTFYTTTWDSKGSYCYKLCFLSQMLYSRFWAKVEGGETEKLKKEVCTSCCFPVEKGIFPIVFPWLPRYCYSVVIDYCSILSNNIIPPPATKSNF